MSTSAQITQSQPKIPEPWLPEHFIESDAPQDWHTKVLIELANQLGVMNDYYYPLIGAAEKLRPKSTQPPLSE